MILQPVEVDMGFTVGEPIAFPVGELIRPMTEHEFEASERRRVTATEALWARFWGHS